jgi:hypothetical protein
MRKIIIHDDYGSGWSTNLGYSNYEIRKFVLEYQPLIEAIERIKDFNEQLDDLEWEMQDLAEAEALQKIEELGKQEVLNNKHPAVIRFKKDMLEKFGENVYFDSWDKLSVDEVNGAVKIKNYDGYESIEYVSQEWV